MICLEFCAVHCGQWELPSHSFGIPVFSRLSQIWAKISVASFTAIADACSQILNALGFFILFIFYASSQNEAIASRPSTICCPLHCPSFPFSLFVRNLLGLWWFMHFLTQVTEESGWKLCRPLRQPRRATGHIEVTMSPWSTKISTHGTLISPMWHLAQVLATSKGKMDTLCLGPLLSAVGLKLKLHLHFLRACSF